MAHVAVVLGLLFLLYFSTPAEDSLARRAGLGDAVLRSDFDRYKGATASAMTGDDRPAVDAPHID